MNFGLRVGLDQVDQQHRVRPLDPRLPGMNLKWQLVLGTQLHDLPEHEILEILELLRRQLVGLLAKGLRSPLLRHVS